MRRELHACTAPQSTARAMADWSLMDRDWQPTQYDPYQYSYDQFFAEEQQQCVQPPPPAAPPPAQTFLPLMPPPLALPEPTTSQGYPCNPPKPDNPREIRNKAEKQRRDKLNQSIGELASMVPPVVAASRKIDKTGVLRLTAHYLRAHQYVFGETINHEEQQFSSMSTRALLSILNGFLLTTTYRGLIVVVSQNVQQYLGYSELDLLGQSVFNIIHEEDRQLMRDMLMPKPHMIGANGELLVPDEPDGKRKVAEALAKEKRRFIIRFKKLGQRSEPSQYVTCHIEGSLRKSDRACRGYNRCCQMVRRARARGDNPCNSGNDVVFVGIVRMATETFITESNMESCRMEYRTRHSIDGQIIQCERRISLVTGYMTHEVKGINAMNFMHRDDVRWVVIALREMYDQHRLFGESCYRLLTKNNQFIYMRTRGRLDVDPNTRAVTSFVCTNTVVDEQQGKHLIKMMKKKFTLMVNNNEETPPEEETKDTNDQNVSVEDPRQLEKVILHLVTNLPSPQTPEDISGNSPDRSTPPCGRLAIIPPKKERIVNAIEKIYSVIKSLPKELENNQKLRLNKVAPNGPSIVSNSVYMEYRESQSCLTTMTPTEPTTLKNNKAENQLVEYSNFKSMERSVVYTSQTITHNMMVPPDEVPSTSHSDTTLESLDGIHGTDHKQDNSINCHLSLPPTGNDDLNILNELNKPLASTSGVKRPRENTEYSEAEAVLKKKSGDALNEVDLTDPNILDETQLFESLFDDNIFNTSFSQLDTAVTSLEQTMDPSFPELLVPQEVQEILQAIENGPTTDLTET